MKQIEKTPAIRALLTASVGEGVDTDGLRVYEAIAFNTLPIRKDHPLYKGARADRNFLLEMSQTVRKESVPLQIMHDKSPLPIGRVFHGEVVDLGADSELRVLFFLDQTADEQALKIESGSVDQVSVSVMSQRLLNSASGFDYLGPDATYENHWSGEDDKGNKIGEKGVYAQMRGLANWWELSLVGQGGAQNARIVARDKSHFGAAYDRLAASGMDPNALVLNASPYKEPTMDLSSLVADLTAKAVELASVQNSLTAAEAQIVALTASIAEREATVAQLTADLAAAGAVDHAAVAVERDEAVAALSATTQKVLTKAGKLNVELPKTVAELSALIDENAGSLVLKVGGASQDAVTDVAAVTIPRATAFRTAAR